MKKLNLLGLCVLLLAGTALAEDVAAPSWRGNPRSTTQEWDFYQPDSTGGDPGHYDAFYFSPDGTGGITDNPYDYYGDAIHLIVEGASDWQDIYFFGPSGGYGPGGQWEIGGNPGNEGSLDDVMTVFIPNSGLTGEGTYKDIRIQITYNNSYDAPYVIPEEWNVGEPGFTFDPCSSTTYPTGDAGWSVLIENWRITPNPEVEGFRIGTSVIDGESYITELVVDTICVPEPMTIALLGLGGLLLRRRKSA